MYAFGLPKTSLEIWETSFSVYHYIHCASYNYKNSVGNDYVGIRELLYVEEKILSRC